MQNVNIATNRLLINRLSSFDKEDYFINISHDKEVLKTFICTYVENINDFDFSKYLNREDIFAIRLKNNKLIGIISVFNNDYDSIEIGYGIGSKHWNNGYVTEAIKAFIDFVFLNTECKTIFASFFPENIASRRVMEKVNMKYSHTSEKELEYQGVWRDLVYYKIER